MREDAIRHNGRYSQDTVEKENPGDRLSGRGFAVLAKWALGWGFPLRASRQVRIPNIGKIIRKCKRIRLV
jgi:hypothetical protein